MVYSNKAAAQHQKQPLIQTLFMASPPARSKLSPSPKPQQKSCPVSPPSSLSVGNVRVNWLERPGEVP